MKPIYFPYTYVPQWVAQALAACFQHFIVYCPSGTKVPHEMLPWVEANIMEIRMPVKIDDDAIKRVVEDYRSFASLHANSYEMKTSAFSRRQGSVPFFDETAVSQIVSEVKKNFKSQTNNTNLDPLFVEQVFLHFAQEFDRQQDELSQELNFYDQRSQKLIKNLRGSDEIDSLAIGPAVENKVDDPAEYMTLDRLQAWVRLFMEDAVDSELFVTSSQSVFNHLIESQPAAEKIIQLTELPAVPPQEGPFITWRDMFLKQIQKLIETEGSDNEHGLEDIPRTEITGIHIALTLYRLPGQSPMDLFAPILGTQSNHIIKFHPSMKSKNALLGYFERQSFKS
ncbi:MAG: hypothetical protein P8X68_07960 [Desulfobacterales bacterium]|jgi:hypothetical protein